MPVFTPKVQPLDPALIEDWARNDMEVSDPDKIAGLQQLYLEWFAGDTLGEAETDDAPQDEMPEFAATFSGGSKNDTRTYIVALNSSQAEIRMMMTSKYDASPLEYARAMWTTGTPEHEGYLKGEKLNIWNSKNLYKTLKERQKNAIWQRQSSFFEQAIDYLGYDGKTRQNFDDERKGTLDIYENIWLYRSKKFLSQVSAIERKKAQALIRQLLNALDPVAVRVMRRARHLEIDLYEWLCGYTPQGYRYERPAKKRVIAGADIQRKRRNFIAAFPVLAGLPIGYDDAKYTEALDAARTPLDALNSMNMGDGVTFNREFLRWVGSLNAMYGHKFADDEGPTMREARQRRRNPDMGRLDVPYWLNRKPSTDVRYFPSLLSSLQALPREWRPTNRKELAAFHKIFTYLSEYPEYVGRSPEQLMRSVFAALRQPRGLPPEWHCVRDTDTLYGRVAELNDRMSRSRGNVSDFFDKLETQIVLPEIFAAAAALNVPVGAIQPQADRYEDGSRMSGLAALARDTLSFVFKPYTFTKIESLSERWHAQAERLADRTGSYRNTDAAWVSLFEPMSLSNGVIARSLASTKDLRAEGEAMDHCVGGYTYHCLFRSSHIVAFSAPDNSWASTLELRESRDSDGKRSFRVAQYQGFNNSEVTREDAAAAPALLIKWLKDHQPDWDAIDAVRSVYAKQEMIIKVGFDPDDKQARDDAYAAWHGTFPDIFREASRDAYMERSGLKDGVRNAILMPAARLGPQVM